MTRTLLSRYERDAQGRVIIDVAASRLEDLYNNFDRSAPYIRRDLDSDLVDYLIECAREIGREPFLIRFTLEHAPDESRLARIRGSVNAYFAYLADTVRQEMFNMSRRSVILLTIGLTILFGSVSLNHYLGETLSVVANVLVEGLTVAAWVSLWEAVATFLIDWRPHRATLDLYRRLAGAPLVFGSAQTTDATPLKPNAAPQRLP